MKMYIPTFKISGLENRTPQEVKDMCQHQANRHMEVFIGLLRRAKEQLPCSCPGWVEIPCIGCDLKDDIEEILENV